MAAVGRTAQLRAAATIASVEGNDGERVSLLCDGVGDGGYNDV